MSRVKLSYATPGAASRVQYVRDGGVARVIVPSPRGRRAGAAVEQTLLIFGAIFLNELGVFVVALVVLAMSSGQYRSELMQAAAVGGGVAALVFVGAWFRYRRLDDPMMIEVTPEAVRLVNYNRDADAHTLPRNLVYDVKFVAHSRRMVIRTRGMEMVEWRPVDDDDEVRRMVEFLREVIGLPGPGGGFSPLLAGRSGIEGDAECST